MLARLTHTGPWTPPREAITSQVSEHCRRKNSQNWKAGFDPTEIIYYLAFYSTQELDKGFVEYTLKTDPEEFIVLKSCQALCPFLTLSPKVVPWTLMRLLGT